MRKSYIIWNGIRSDQLGLEIEKYPQPNRPARKYTVADVPGRNGSAYILQDAWGEIVQSYVVSAKNPVCSFKAIAEWLHSADGYAVLEDSYDPGTYRMAVCVNAFQVETAMNRAGRAMIQFNCRPERYLKGENIEIATQNRTIENITPHDAHPLLRIEGQGYPSMLPMTGRTNLSNNYDYSYKIEGLTAAKVRYNFIGLSSPYKEETGSWNIDQNPSRINSHSETDGSINITANQGGYGVGLNRSVNPLTTYTLSFVHGTSNPRTDKVAIVLTDKNGEIVSNAGEINAAPFATRQKFTFTTTADSYWAVIIFIPTERVTAPCIFSDIQLNLGEEALPYIPFSSSTASEIQFGDVIIHLSELGDYLNLDCETMNAYRQPDENLNPTVAITDLNGNQTTKFPRLVPGNTEIKSDNWGWIENLVITPRFWTL